MMKMLRDQAAEIRLCSEKADGIDAMEAKRVAAGEVVIEQGASGDYFYLVESGDYHIEVEGAKVGEAGPGRISK